MLIAYWGLHQYLYCFNSWQVHGTNWLSLDPLCRSAVEKEKQIIYNFRRTHLYALSSPSVLT